MWFVVHECHNPIPTGRYHYDSTQMDNFTLCEKCYRKNKTHTCKFNKVKVKPGEGPPDNSKDLIKQAFLLCSVCNISLIDISKSIYYCKESSPQIAEGRGVFWCKKCKDATEHPTQRTKIKGNDIATLFGVEGLADAAQGNSGTYLNSLFEDYHNLETSTSKKRFKYETVPADDFGLTNEDIFMLDD